MPVVQSIRRYRASEVPMVRALFKTL
jgi:hypothetical protein